MKTRVLLIAVFVFGALSGACSTKAQENTIVLTGTVESDTVRVSSLIPGRLEQVNATEGAKINRGDVVAQVDCADLELQQKQADFAVQAAFSQLALVKKGARAEDILAAKELVNQATIADQKLEREHQRLLLLKQAGSIPEKEFDDITTQRDAAKSKLQQATAQYDKVRRGPRKEEIDSAVALYNQAGSSLEILNKKITDCVVKAPLNATVLHRLAEPGEVVGAGTPIVILADLTTVKITAFIEERDLGHVKPGMSARIRVDSFPDKPLTARVSRIANEAEFTPKTIQTREERVKTVFRIQLTADNNDGILKPGMPVDVVFEKNQQQADTQPIIPQDASVEGSEQP